MAILHASVRVGLESLERLSVPCTRHSERAVSCPLCAGRLTKRAPTHPTLAARRVSVDVIESVSYPSWQAFDGLTRRLAPPGHPIICFAHDSEVSMASLRASSSARMVEALLQSITDDPVRRKSFANTNSSSQW